MSINESIHNPEAKADRHLRNRINYHDAYQVNQMILPTDLEQEEETNDLSDPSLNKKPVRQILI